MKKWTLLSIVLAPLVSALLFSSALPPNKHWYLAYIALVPLLWSLFHRSSGPSTRYPALLFGIFVYEWNLRWFVEIFGLVGLVLPIALSLILFTFAVHLAALRRAVGVGGASAFTPVLWVGYEYLRAEVWPLRFGWITPGLTQVETLEILQSASWIGGYGLTAIVVGANAAITYSFIGGTSLLVRLSPPLLAALLVTSLYLAGSQATQTSPQGSIPVAAVQYETHDMRDGERLSRLISRGTKLVAWPEVSVMNGNISSPDITSRLASLARDLDAHLLVGGEERLGSGPNEFENTALLIDNTGVVKGRYVKGAPIPLFLDGRAGTSLYPINTPLGRVGIAICYDLDNPFVIHPIVSNGAELLVVPTADRLTWGALQHEQHAVVGPLRAVEYGRWILRPSSSGYSQIIDPVGNIRYWGGLYPRREGCFRVKKDDLSHGRIPSPQDLSDWDHTFVGLPTRTTALRKIHERRTSSRSSQ